jgi:PAS domain S-box-containing protein
MTVSLLHVRPSGRTPLDFSGTALDDVSVTTVTTEAGALDALAGSEFDCVVAEQSLDAGTGLAVLRQVRDRRPSLPVVLCSATADGHLASEATRYDVTAYHLRDGAETVEERVADALADRAVAADESGLPAALSDGATTTHGTAFASIADTLTDAVVTIDADSYIHFANDSLSTLTGYDHREVIGEPFTKLMPEQYREDHLQAVTEYVDSGERTLDWDYLELALEHADGHEIPVTVSFSEFERDGNRFFTGVLRDVSSRKSQARSLRDLHEVASDPSLSAMEKIRAVVDQHRERLGVSFAFLSRIEDDTETFLAVVGDTDLAADGAEYPLSDTYCQHTIDSEEPVVVTDPEQARALDARVHAATGLSCYLGETVTVDGEQYGTLCFADTKAREEAFDEADVAFLEVLADWVGYELQQREQREQLREERQRVENVLERVDDAFFALDDDWRFTYFNRRAEEVLGRSSEAVMGENIWEVYEDALGSTFDEKYHEAMDRQEPVTFEEYYPPLDQWFQVSAYPSEDGLSVYFSDVTDRRRYTRALSKMHEATRDLARDGTVDAVAQTVLSATVDVLGCPVGAIRQYDADTDRIRPVALTEAVREMDGERPAYSGDCWGLGEAMDRQEPVHVEDFQARARAEPDGPGADELADVTSALFVPIDETRLLSLGTTDPDGFDEQTRSLAELLASHAALAFERVERERELRVYETVLESVQGMVYAMDTEERLALATDRLASWLGYDRDELVGSGPDIVLDEAEIERFRAAIASLRDSEKASTTVETELVTADGSRLPAEIEISAVLEGSGFDGTIGVVRDLTELRETRQQLELERDRFSYLFDSVPDAIVDVRFADGRPVVEATNDAFNDIFGYSDETVVGESLNEFILPDSKREAGERIDEYALDGESWQGEVRRLTDEGFRYFIFRGIPYRDSEGDLRGFGIYTDITERKQRERRLQVLNRVFRHNLRNDLTILLGYAEMLRDDVEDERLADVAASLCERIHSVSALSEEARAVQETLGDQPDSRHSESLQAFLTAAVEDCLAGETEATVEVDVDPELRAAVDERLGLAVRNLVENALEHAGEAPQVRVSAAADGDVLTLSVADDGPGIPDLEWNVVTGKQEITQLSHSSGLGLWTVKWVADSYGGRIEREGSDLGGTRVVLRLPVLDG